MAIDKAIDSAQLDADLTSVADAIRAKGGTSAALTFPAGFVDAVEAIETGGGGGYSVDEIAENGIQGALNITVSKIKRYAFCRQEIKSLNGPNVRSIGDGAFQYSEVETILLPNYDADEAPSNVFNNLTELTYLYAPKMKKVGLSSIRQCRILPTITLPSVTDIGQYGFFQDPKLESADFGGNSLNIGANAFGSCSILTTLVLRCSTVATLANINAFSSTPFASGKTGGTLYVPSALISDYQSATNWSTILGYENNKILPIEGSVYETQYADGTPIPTA